MKIEINKIITLGNQEKYLVIDKVVHNDIEYYYVAEVNEDETNIKDNYKIVEASYKDNNIYLDAVWESSNGGGDTPDPSQNDDPIDNPQTGSIVIYLVLLFGIGALVYSVWYFRGFREN